MLCTNGTVEYMYRTMATAGHGGGAGEGGGGGVLGGGDRCAL